MIAKCIAVLAIVAQINASGCGCGPSSIVLSGSGSIAPSSPVAFVSSGSASGFSSGAITRNLIGKGKFPVALSSCGPTPDQQIPVTTSRLTAPVQEKPTVRLPASIPAPRTISHSCTCYKTVLRPRVQQQIITVPSIQRYIETTHKPVVENIQYEALPVNCAASGASSGSGVQFLGVGSSSGSVQLISSGSSPVQAFGIPSPQVQVVSAPSVQTVEIPSVQAVEVPRVQAIEIPSPQVQVVASPPVQVVEAPRVQAIEIPSPQIQVVASPPVQVVEAPRVQIPQAISFGSSSSPSSCFC